MKFNKKVWAATIALCIVLVAIVVTCAYVSGRTETSRFPSGWFCYDGKDYIVEYRVKYDNGTKGRVREKVPREEWQHAWEEYSNWKSELEWMEEHGVMGDV